VIAGGSKAACSFCPDISIRDKFLEKYCDLGFTCNNQYVIKDADK
jgi:hypothetical protein